ncbi:MAG: hypothetical protein LV477_04985 [Candidatus Nitrosotalea sp.]|nr:hypothetical protein [Candidatus Nitrosotalea sp.]
MMVPTSKKTKQVSLNYNIDVMQRILNALYEMGKSRITYIAVHAGLNNNTTKRYLNLMKMFAWVEFEKEEGAIVLRLTETGIFIHNQLHDTMPGKDTSN